MRQPATEARFSLTIILGSIRDSINTISEMIEPPGSKIDEIKLYLNALGSAESLQFDIDLIYNTLNKLVVLLSNGEVQKTLSPKINLTYLLGAIKRAQAIFYPYVFNTHTLSEVKVARLEANATFGTGGDEKFYVRLNELLEQTGGRSDYYKNKAIRNEIKKDAFRFLDNVVKTRFSPSVIWPALQLLLMVSEPGSEARKLFCEFYNTEFPKYLDTLPKARVFADIPNRFEIDGPQSNKLSEDDIARIFRRIDILFGKDEDAALTRLRAMTLWQIVKYDRKLSLEASSFCHYSKMGKKTGQTTNRGKRFEARNLLYSVLMGGNAIQILKAMSGFVLHTKPGSDGEKIFREFYFKSCAEYFSDSFLLGEKDGQSYIALYSEKVKDDMANWVLYAALHSIVMSNRKLFKEALVEGDAETLRDLAAGIKTKKPLKCALLKLRLSVEHGADLSQLSAVVTEVIQASQGSEGGQYSIVAKTLDKTYQSFTKFRVTEDIRDGWCFEEFKKIDVPALSGAISEIAKSSIKLGLELANLRIKIQLATREDVYLTLSQLLSEFGEEIKEKSSPLFAQLLSIFIELSYQCRIHPIGDDGKRFIYVPLSWKLQKGHKYTLEPIVINSSKNEAFGPACMSNLQTFLNIKLVDQVELVSEMNSIHVGQSITIYQVLEHRLPLLQIDFDIEKGSVSIKTCNSASFDNLDANIQIRILRRVFEAFSLAFKKLPVKDQEEEAGKNRIEKEIQQIAEAADFLEGLSSAQREAVQPSRGSAREALSRSSKEGGRSRGSSLVDAVKKKTTSLGTFFGGMSSGRAEPVISGPELQASVKKSGAKPSPLSQSGVFSPVSSSTTTPPPSAAVTPKIAQRDSEHLEELPSDLPPPPSAELPKPAVALACSEEDDVEEDSSEGLSM